MERTSARSRSLFHSYHRLTVIICQRHLFVSYRSVQKSTTRRSFTRTNSEIKKVERKWKGAANGVWIESRSRGTKIMSVFSSTVREKERRRGGKSAREIKMTVRWDEEGSDSCFIIFVKRRTWQGLKKEEAVINREPAYLPENSSVSLRLLLSLSFLWLPLSYFSLSFLVRATRRSVKISSQLFPSHYASYPWIIRLLIFINRYILVIVEVHL